MNISNQTAPLSRNNRVSLPMNRPGILSPAILTLGLLISVFFANTVHAEFQVQDVSAYEAIELLGQNPDIKILDVRTAAEFASGHVKGAVNLDYFSSDFKANLEKLDKNATWLVHCHRGPRSGNTMPLLQAAGFTNIIHMTYGFDEWARSGLPVSK